MRFLLPVFLLVAATTAAQPRITVPNSASVSGSVPSSTPSAEPPVSTIADAMTRGLQRNLAALIPSNTREMARRARWTALAELLPDVRRHARVQPRAASVSFVRVFRAFGVLLLVMLPLVLVMRRPRPGGGPVVMH
jgi:hypothetical protein